MTDITIKPNQDNDLIALVNEKEPGSVSVGDSLIVQNKSDNYVYVQQSGQPTTNFQSGLELKRSWKMVTDAGTSGVRATCGGAECDLYVGLASE